MPWEGSRRTFSNVCFVSSNQITILGLTYGYADERAAPAPRARCGGSSAMMSLWCVAYMLFMPLKTEVYQCSQLGGQYFLAASGETV